MEADRELVPVVVRLEIGPDFDGALRALQCPEEPLEVLGGRLATAQVDGADHKSRLQELSAHLFSTPPRY